MAVAVMCGAAPLYATAWLAIQSLLGSYPVAVRRWADERMYAEYQEFCRIFFQLYTGCQFHFHGDAPQPESVLYIANHQCTIDWLIVPLLASQVGQTGGVRYVLKNTLRLMPCYGWYFEQHGCVYVRKDSGADHSRLHRALALLRCWTSPVWLAIFPEGTRFNPARAATLAASNDFASTHGRRPTSHVLAPRTKGFQLCVAALRARGGLGAAAVYDITVAYHRRSCAGHTPAPSMAELMAGDCPIVHVFMRRHPMASLPTDETALATWLFDRFAVKDRLLAQHYGAAADAADPVDAEAAAQLADGRTWTYDPPAWKTALRMSWWTAVAVAATCTPTGRAVYAWSWGVTGLGGLLLMLPLL